jgi:outer membrane protein
LRIGKTLKLVLAVLGCVAAFSATAAPLDAGARIGAVNSDRILSESAPAKAAQARLESEFAKRDKDLKDMAARLKSMSDDLDRNTSMSSADRAQKQQELAQLDSDFQRKQREFREDLNQRRNEELAAVLDKANKVIKQIAEQQNYDLIVQEGAYISPRIDITDRVLKALAASSAAAN